MDSANKSNQGTSSENTSTENTDYIIRKANEKDGPILTNHNILMALETENIKLEPEIAEKGVESVLNDPTKGHYYVLVKQNEIIAQLMITFEWSDWRDAEIWWIQSVYVKKEFRNQGYFKKLFNYVKDEACKEGKYYLRLYCDDMNNNAQKVYHKLGMTSHYRVFEICLK